MPAGTVQVLPRVGSLVEGPAFYPQLSGRDNLARVDAADRTADPGTAKARVGAALERVGLLAAKKKHYRAYSLGMKQRLAIAASLLQPRELIILDEPTNGLDPQGTREVRGLIREIATDGITVLVSSHLLAEVEQICTQVGVMRTGRLVFQGPLDELRDRGAARTGHERRQPGRRCARQAGLADVRLPRRGQRASATTRRSSCRSWSRRRPGRAGHAAAEPGGPVRRAHRGGLRCRRLSWPLPAGPRRARGAAGRAAGGCPAWLRLLRSELR